jgi:uncharacterized membrane protein YdjX (TVP38/TMEM64 family)
LKRAIRILALGALVALIVLAAVYRDRFDSEALLGPIRELGPWGPLLFIALYVLATVLFLPGSVLTLAAGALFGPLWGPVYALVGATVGATAAFLLARHLLAGWVRARARGWLRRVVEGVEAEGWRFVAFTRLVPIFPFNALNYALGLTRIPLWSYVLTSLICMAPAAFAYAYLGYAGREALAGGESVVQKALLALGLIALILFLPRFLRRIRGRERMDPGE